MTLWDDLALRIIEAESGIIKRIVCDLNVIREGLHITARENRHDLVQTTSVELIQTAHRPPSRSNWDGLTTTHSSTTTQNPCTRTLAYPREVSRDTVRTKHIRYDTDNAHRERTRMAGV